MKVKICGITNLEDALDAINAGADALGFVFYEKSPRYIEPFKAREIVKELPPFIQTVGLFVNENSAFINQICTNAKIQMAQIYDDDNYTDLVSLNYKYIEVVRAKSKEDILDNLEKYVLIDAYVQEYGGSGKRVALEWFKGLDCSKIVLAGGLDENNLKELNGFNFYGVDVSSGVELAKGKKDKTKMVNFVKAVNEVQQ